MKLNQVFKICLFSAILLVGSVLLVQAAGFISFEDNNKVIIWDNVRKTGSGLKISEFGINDTETVEHGIIKVMDKDLYVRHLMGFNCPNYPQEFNCQAVIGDIGGNTFLEIDNVEGDSINLISETTNIDLNGDPVILDTNSLILCPSSPDINTETCTGIDAESNNLVVSDLVTDEEDSDSVFVNSLRVNLVTNNPDRDDSLYLPKLRFSEGAIFNPQRIIYIDKSKIE